MIPPSRRSCAAAAVEPPGADLTATSSPSPAAKSDTTAPDAPDGLTGTAIAGTTAAQVDLSWNNPYDNVATSHYEVFRNGTSIGTGYDNALDVTGLALNTTYTFKVRAFDAAGNVARGTAATTTLNQAAAAGATAMIDVSDGLLLDAGHLAEQSAVAIDVRSDALEVPEPLEAVAAATGADPLRFVLTGGEDHALLATFEAATVPEGWSVIGAVSEGAGVTVDGAAYDGPAHRATLAACGQQKSRPEGRLEVGCGGRI